MTYRNISEEQNRFIDTEKDLWLQGGGVWERERLGV